MQITAAPTTARGALAEVRGSGDRVHQRADSPANARRVLLAALDAAASLKDSSRPGPCCSRTG